MRESCLEVTKHLYARDFHAKKTDHTLSSGFRKGDSCTSHFFSFIHEIYKSFDDGYEAKDVFLDISKESDNVQHPGLQ